MLCRCFAQGGNRLSRSKMSPQLLHSDCFAVLVTSSSHIIQHLRAHPRTIRSIPDRPDCTPVHRAMTTSPGLTFPFSQPPATPSIARLIGGPSSTRCSASSLRAYASKSPLLLTPLPPTHGCLCAINGLIKISCLLLPLLHW